MESRRRLFPKRSKYWTDDAATMSSSFRISRYTICCVLECDVQALIVNSLHRKRTRGSGQMQRNWFGSTVWILNQLCSCQYLTIDHRALARQLYRGTHIGIHHSKALHAADRRQELWVLQAVTVRKLVEEADAL